MTLKVPLSHPSHQSKYFEYLQNGLEFSAIFKICAQNLKHILISIHENFLDENVEHIFLSELCFCNKLYVQRVNFSFMTFYVGIDTVSDVGDVYKNLSNYFQTS